LPFLRKNFAMIPSIKVFFCHLHDCKKKRKEILFYLTYYGFNLFFYTYPNFMVRIWNLKLLRRTECTSSLCFGFVITLTAILILHKQWLAFRQFCCVSKTIYKKALQLFRPLYNNKKDNLNKRGMLISAMLDSNFLKTSSEYNESHAHFSRWLCLFAF